MSLSIKNRRGKDYWTFVGGRGNELHLGPADDISKINSDRVIEALNYLTERNIHYVEIRDKLLSFLPQDKLDDYVLSYLNSRDEYSDKKLISSLSEDTKAKYLRTRLRRLEEELQKIEQISLGKGSSQLLSTKPVKLNPSSRIALAGPTKDELDKIAKKRLKKKKKKKTK